MAVMWQQYVVCQVSYIYIFFWFLNKKISLYLLIQKHTLWRTSLSTDREKKIVWRGPCVKGARGKISPSNRHHTTNGQLSTVNHLSALIINHIRAAKCGMTTTLSAFVRMMIISHWSCCWITAQYKTWIIISISLCLLRHNTTILWCEW